MKRGPSKGYIKELADRLNHLEGAMQAGELPAPPYMGAQQDNAMQRRASDEFSPPPNPADNMTRKRTYSSLSGDLNSAYATQRPSSAWATQELARHPGNSNSAFSPPQPTPNQLFREPDYSQQGMAPTPQWKKAPEPSRRPSTSFESMLASDFPQTDRSPGWDDATIDGYMRIIHPTYPILFASKSKLSSMVSAYSTPLKDAFYEALHAAVRSFPTSNSQVSASAQQSFKKTAQLVMASQFENTSSHSLPTSILHLQTMMLLVIATENLRWRGQAGLPLSSWLGSAVGLAYSMKLHIHRPQKATGTDDDTEEKLCRRLWWSLVIMDRWHASSTSSPLLIPDGSVVVYPDDQPILGDSLYHMARLSVVLGHFTIAQSDLPALSVPPSQLVATLLRGELERWRESLPDSILSPSSSPLLHLCYWSTRILLELRRPDSEPQELLEHAIRIGTQLVNNSNLVTPLTYHATILATLALVELNGHSATRKEAEEGLKSILESRIAPSSCDISVRTLISKKSRPLTGLGMNATTANATEGQHDATSSQNLQRLADLATATEGVMDATANEGTKEVDNSHTITPSDSPALYQNLRKTIHEGYITAILGADLIQ